jgi:tetratricopeptide (TPR) repeat protein
MRRNPGTGAAILLVLLLAASLLGLASCMLAKYGGDTTETEPSHGGRYQVSEESKERFLASIRPPKENPDSLYNNACYFQQRNKHKLAIEEFKRVLAIDPNYTKAYNGMGVSYDLLGDYANAIKAYERALTLTPESDYVYNNLGYCSLLKGEFNSAIAAFRKAISLNDQNKLYHNNLGLAYAMRGDDELAFIELRLAGDAAKAQYILGKIYYQKGAYVEARARFAEALANNPSLPNAENYLKAATTLAKITGTQPPQQAVSGIISPSNGDKVVSEGERDAVIARTDAVKGAEKNNAALVALPEQDVEIEVSNGNGVRHMAKRLGSYLNERGFQRVRLTNASHFGYASTRIYYRQGYLNEAAIVGENLPMYRDMREVKTLSKRDTKIRVIIGKDLIRHIEHL